MRLVSFLAPTSKQAMANLRADLGEDAVILSTKTLADGNVQVTGAVAEDALDLASVLEPSSEPRSLDWLAALADFHEWPFGWHQQLAPVLNEIEPAEPEAILTTLVRAIGHFGSLAGGKRKPLLLSGPPGAGKTVTIAKLAAREILQGRTVDILALDTAQAGALDRLERLLAPLDLQPKPVSGMAELDGAITRSTSDVVLLDGPSTNPFKPSDLGALSALTNRSGADLVLVLPANQGYGDSIEIARSYLALGATRLVVTKLDVVRRLGGFMAALEAGLTLTHVGIGPTIGDGLRTLSAAGLARLLLRRFENAVDQEVSR